MTFGALGVPTARVRGAELVIGSYLPERVLNELEMYETRNFHDMYYVVYF